MNNWEKYHTEWSKRDEIPSNPRIIKEILSLGSVKGKKILEVGSGMGRDCIYLAKLGGDVTLLDFIELPLVQAKILAKKHNVEIKTILCDVFELSNLTEKYDLVFSQGLLEHFKEPKIILIQKKKVCKKGGYIIADVPQTFHVYTLIKKLLSLMGKWTPGWETQFTINQVENFFKQTGISIIRSYGDWSHPFFFLKVLFILLGKRNYLQKEYKDNIFKKLLRSKRISFYTYQHIGVIGKNDIC